MPLSTEIWGFMERKNVKVSEELVDQLNARAERLGLIQYRLAEALLTAGLALPDEELYEAVKRLSAGDTKRRGKLPAA